VLPLIPAYMSYLAGRATMQSSLELSTGTVSVATTSGGSGVLSRTGNGGFAIHVNKLIMLIHALFFVAGFTLIFVVFGLLTNAGVAFLDARAYDVQKLIARLGGILIIFFGLHILGLTGWVLNKLIAGAQETPGSNQPGRWLVGGLHRIQAFLYGDTRKQINPRNRYGYVGSAAMGVAFAAGWTPCVGPIYGSIVTLAINSGQTHNYNLPAMLLLAYSLGLGLPFLIASVALERVRGLLKRIQRQMRVVEIISGVLLIIIGYLLLTDSFSYFNQFFIALNGPSYNLETCSTAVLNGEMPIRDYGTCMNLGSNYKDVQAENFWGDFAGFLVR
jgi:cytochrome c-type biogenesis protein